MNLNGSVDARCLRYERFVPESVSWHLHGHGGGDNGVGPVRLQVRSRSPSRCRSCRPVYRATSAASVSGQTVSVSWNRPSDGGDPELDYTVSLSNGASADGHGNTSAQFFSVAAGNYTASVTASNSAGPGPTGTSLGFSVFTVPSAPLNLAAAADGSSVVASLGTARIEWQPNPYRLCGSAGTERSVLETQDVDATTSSVRFDNRSPAIYRVVVSARTPAGVGAGAAVNVEVGSTSPSAPTNVSASATFQTVTVTWDPPLSVGNTALTGYEVTVGSSD